MLLDNTAALRKVTNKDFHYEQFKHVLMNSLKLASDLEKCVFCVSVGFMLFHIAFEPFFTKGKTDCF